MSWYDPPGNDGTNSPALVHDLDLVITSPSGETYFSNGGDDLDSLNNNEQIHIDSGFGTGTWKVTTVLMGRFETKILFIFSLSCFYIVVFILCSVPVLVLQVVISSQALPYSGQQLFSLIITSRGSVATGDDNGGEIYDDGGSDNYEDADDRRDDDEST